MSTRPKFRFGSRRRADMIAQAGDANGFRAMFAAEEGAVLLEAVPDDADATVLAGWRQRMDRALEAVEGVGGAVHGHLKRLVVVVSTGFTSGHDNLTALARFGGLEAITPPCRGRFRPVCAPAAALFAPVSPDAAFLRKNGRENAPPSVNLLFRRRDQLPEPPSASAAPRGRLGGWSNVRLQACSWRDRACNRRCRGDGACRQSGGQERPRCGRRRRQFRGERRSRRPGRCQERSALRSSPAQARRSSAGHFGLSARAVAVRLPMADTSRAQGLPPFAAELTAHKKSGIRQQAFLPTCRPGLLPPMAAMKIAM